MNPPSAEIAARFGLSPEQLERRVAAVAGRVPYRTAYVFRIAPRPPSDATSTPRPRSVVAFPSADDALTWAQRTGQSAGARLKAITPTALLLRLLTDSSISAIRFLLPQADVTPTGPAIEITRAELLQLLDHAAEGTPSATPPATTPRTPPLSAGSYDALQFGIDFRARAHFRAELAAVLDQIVDTYQPPPGSLDQGPRSIYAVTAVEAWLRSHGFPRARQRRWITVAGDPAWGGASELYEIDAGTTNRLLVQLLIAEDHHGRQYIRDVLVTA